MRASRRHPPGARRRGWVGGGGGHSGRTAPGSGCSHAGRPRAAPGAPPLLTPRRQPGAHAARYTRSGHTGAPFRLDGMAASIWPNLRVAGFSGTAACRNFSARRPFWCRIRHGGVAAAEQMADMGAGSGNATGLPAALPPAAARRRVADTLAAWPPIVTRRRAPCRRLLDGIRGFAPSRWRPTVRQAGEPCRGCRVLRPPPPLRVVSGARDRVRAPDRHRHAAKNPSETG